MGLAEVKLLYLIALEFDQPHGLRFSGSLKWMRRGAQRPAQMNHLASRV